MSDTPIFTAKDISIVVTKQELIDLRALVYTIKHGLNGQKIFETVEAVQAAYRKLTDLIEMGERKP